MDEHYLKELHANDRRKKFLRRKRDTSPGKKYSDITLFYKRSRPNKSLRRAVKIKLNRYLEKDMLDNFTIPLCLWRNCRQWWDCGQYNPNITNKK
jgi:hypothetical protein